MTRILHTGAAAFFLLQLGAFEAFAHVRAPGHSLLDRKVEAGPPETGSVPRLEGRGGGERGLAKPRAACGLSFDLRLSADALLAGSAPGVPALTEARLDGGRADAAVYQEVLSLFEGFDLASDIVVAAEGVTPEGEACPLYVTVGTDGSRQTFWRFAPDDEPAGWFDDRGRRLGDAALAPPRPGSRMSSPFGPRRYYGRLSGSGFHNGIDFESRIGEPIYAAADGTVELREGHFEYGLTVKIRHAARYTTLYAHLSRFANGLAVGSPVRKGQLIGYVGMTGRSTGAHLHFSTIVDGRFVDPMAYLSRKGPRTLTAPSLATFRQWQQNIRAAVAPHDRKPRPHPDTPDWTTRI